MKTRAFFFFFGVSIFLFCFLGCASTPSVQYTEEQIIEESKKVNDFFEADFEAALERSPEEMTAFGIKKKYEQLDDESYENYQKEMELSKEAYEKLLSFDYNKLDAATKVSYDLYVHNYKRAESSAKYYFHRYFLNQMYGRHTELVNFMMEYHTIKNEPQAWSYISRLEGFEKAINDVIAKIQIQKERGIKYPHFVFEHVIRDCKNILRGFPFQNVKKDSDLFKDFRSKIARIPSEPKIKNILMNKAKLSMVRYVKPSYLKLIALMEEMQKEQTEVQGVWALPDGAAYYIHQLKQITTTDLTPQQIHHLGLKEVERIHQQMKQIMTQLGFDGTLQEFFEAIKADSKLHYPNTYLGRQEYLKDTQKIIDAIALKTDELFNLKPKAQLVVKPVEKYREKSAAVAFYERPTPDGSLPGRYYVNLADMSTVPKYDMEALAYHEAIPGHHMQIAIAQELEGLPKFRLYSHYGSYIEGWGLYAESLPKEIGFYQDLYSEFGRLSMELWRATRLVVDTGIHFYKWTKEQAVDYMTQNTSNSADKNLKEVERYFVMPGQAVSYKVGQLKILELRKKAEKALKSKFNLKDFHDVILKNGAVPFPVLEKEVNQYTRVSGAL